MRGRDARCPGENPFAPSGQLGTEPLAYAEAALDASAPAWTAIGEDAGPVPTPLPQGPMAPAAAAGAAALDAAIHAWDIAMATGQGSPLTPELARALTPVAHSIVEPLRQYGAYAQALEPSAGADDADGAAVLPRPPPRLDGVAWLAEGSLGAHQWCGRGPVVAVEGAVGRRG